MGLRHDDDRAIPTIRRRPRTCWPRPACSQGFKVELLAYSSPRGYNPAGPDLAVAMQGYFQKVGIEADVRKLDMGAFLAQVRSGKYPGMFMSGFSGDNGDPDNFLYSLFYSKQMPVGDTVAL